ncbi:LmbE family N-acetylglucosaminyl deacetylase [Kineosphaera limosa]|nr:PIG-L family deacetylase [Kineosphaera limosa]NYE01799.1 LmbE family N-acetylglucosaminyl deacetylase [Kineosphaera limosa]
MSRTVVAVNAHPDDEALLMAGTLAKAAAAGHRVVLVVATDGDLGLTSAQHRGSTLGQRRLAELHASAAAIGAARLEWLGYADSGMEGPVPPDPPGRQRFLHADPRDAAVRIADILREEEADVVIGYDPSGGYGHRDHVRVHEVTREAARLAGTPRLLEATVPREAITAGISLARRLPGVRIDVDLGAWERAFTPRSQITHRIGVRGQIRAKRTAMAAHATQAAADDGADRTLAAFGRIPRPLYDLIFGREWFVDPAADAGAPISRDIFAGLP